MEIIPFNKPFLTGKELHYIYQAVYSGKISGNGEFTKKCQHFFVKKYEIKKSLMTTSCTDALEMAALLCDIKLGDEVILPSYTFVSTANAFVLRGAKLIFCDSEQNNPNIDCNKIEELITNKTKAIIVVHYAGVACDMDNVCATAKKYNLIVIEDAAQAIDSYYKDRPLGSIGQLAAFSFHETKNIISGEGGMLAINDEQYNKRAEIIWEKGTNRAEFSRGEVNKYGWVDMGSSFLPSEIISAFLYAQLENLDTIQSKRKQIWNNYYSQLDHLEREGQLTLPKIPSYSTNNAHMFYLVCNSANERVRLLEHFKNNNILAVFHYLSLHNSEYYKDKHDKRNLPNSDLYSERLLRLPLFYELTLEMQEYIIQTLCDFYKG